MARRSQQYMHELVGAYALDAVEPEEAEAFELHLAECPKCRAELAAHRETAAMLAHVGAPAPEGIWDRIAAELEEAPADSATVLPFAPRKRQRFIVAALAAAAAVIAINSAMLVQQRNEISELKPTSAASLRALADEAMTAPGSRVALLRGPDGTVGGEVVVTADGHGYFVRSTLRDLEADRAYQLWGITADGLAVSLGVLGAEPEVTSFAAKLPIKDLAITVEKAGGALTPSATPLVRGPLQPAT